MRLRLVKGTLAALALLGAGVLIGRISRDVAPRPVLVRAMPPVAQIPPPASLPTLLIQDVAAPPQDDPKPPPLPQDQPGPLPADPLPSLPAEPVLAPASASLAPRKLSLTEAAVMPAAGPATPPPSAEADPVRLVEAFVAQNRRQAGDSIKSLTAEAEQLKARLAKVEAALARWRAISAALGDEGDIEARRPAAEEPPPDLRVIEEPKGWTTPQPEPAPARRSSRQPTIVVPPPGEPIPGEEVTLPEPGTPSARRPKRPNAASEAPADAEPAGPAPTPARRPKRRPAATTPPASPDPDTIFLPPPGGQPAPPPAPSPSAVSDEASPSPTRAT